MFSLLFTIALVYFIYRGSQWYAQIQKQVKRGEGRPHDRIDVTPPEDSTSREDDYIDYEEVK